MVRALFTMPQGNVVVVVVVPKALKTRFITRIDKLVFKQYVWHLSEMC